jgi:hypothetical protein
MAQRGGRTSKPLRSPKPRKSAGQAQRGSRGREGQQYQQKDMGAHPAYGKHVRDPDGKDAGGG